jgi:hypothetical protein
VAFNISKEKTKNDLVEALAKLYEKPSASNKVFLIVGVGCFLVQCQEVRIKQCARRKKKKHTKNEGKVGQIQRKEQRPTT